MKELLREPDNNLSSYASEAAEIIDVCAGGKHSLVLAGSGFGLDMVTVLVEVAVRARGGGR